jgi:hypothetical protein
MHSRQASLESKEELRSRYVILRVKSVTPGCSCVSFVFLICSSMALEGLVMTYLRVMNRADHGKYIVVLSQV